MARGEACPASLSSALANDHAINAAEWIVYDALYAYCREMIARGRPEGAYR